ITTRAVTSRFIPPTMHRSGSTKTRAVNRGGMCRMNEGVDYSAVTEIQQKAWSEGDFAKIGVSALIVAEELCEAVEVVPGERLLDVACGAGNGAIAAARRNLEAVGLDYVPALLERGRERAAAEGYEIEFVEGDAQELPFEDESFDVVISTF